MTIKPSRYILVFGLAMIAISIVIFAISSVFQSSFGTVWTPLVPAVVAAMIEGRAHARATAQNPTRIEAWKAAAIMTGLALGLFILLAGFLLQAQPQIIAAIGEQPGRVIGGVLLFCFLWLVTNWFFYTIGIRNERAAARRRGS